MKSEGTTKRILVVETGSGLGGSARALGEMLRSIDMNGLFVTVLFTRPDAATERVRAAGAEILKTARPLGRSPQRWLSDSVYLYRLLTHLRPAVVHLNNELYSSVSAIVAARLRGIPVVCHLRSERPPTRIEKLLAPLCRRFVAISERGRKFYRRRLPGAGSRIEVIRDCFAKITPREKTGDSPRPMTLGMTSNLVRGKGHEHVLAAMPQILRKCPDTRLIIAGCATNERRYEDELRGRVVELGLERHVTFAGWQDDISRFLGGIDVLIEASCLSEGYRHTIVEAMRAGVPVVATDVGPAREIIRSAAEGVLVPPRDPETIAEAVCMLLENPCRAGEISRRARLAARGRFRAGGGALKIENLYRRAAMIRRD